MQGTPQPGGSGQDVVMAVDGTQPPGSTHDGGPQSLDGGGDPSRLSDDQLVSVLQAVWGHQQFRSERKSPDA
jgi:hypothetical protein